MKPLFSTLALAIIFLSCSSNDQYFIETQKALAENGNYWAKYELWQAYSKGKHGTEKDKIKADQLAEDLTEGVYLVKFEPIDDFNPKMPDELLQNFNDNSSLRSEKEKIGGASFFRTKAIESKLIGSFLTAYPNKLIEDIEKNKNLKLLSCEKITPQLFIDYESSVQESLK